MTQIPLSTQLDSIDRGGLADRPADDERLRVVRLVVDAVVHRLDDMWFTSTDLRDGPHGVGMFEARQLLHRAVAVLDSGAS
jgi:hypothetical protein